MVKKYVSILLGICLIGTMAGCGNEGESESTDEKTVISFYSWSENAEQDFDKAIIAQFEKENPDIDVEEVFVPYSEYLSKMNTMAAAESLPDVFKLPEGNVLEWGEKGALLDVKPLFEEAGVDLENFMVNSAIFQVDENVWGVGCNVATIALYYNKDLFEQAGIEVPSSDADNPWTWEELVNAARKLTKDANGNTSEDPDFDSDNIAVYGTMMPTDWNVFIPLLYTNGAGIANEEGTELLINTPEGIEVIQSIADLSQVYQCAPSVAMAEGAFADKTTMLMNGQVAMLIDGSWSLGTYANEGFDVGVAQIPMFSQPANMSWTAGICMAPESAENEAAFEFYQYYTDFSNALSTSLNENVALGGLPHTLNVFDDGENEADWIATYTEVDETANCEMFKDILNQEGTRLGENVTLKNFPSIVDSTIMSALDNVWLGNQTAEEALSSINVDSDLQGVWN